MTTSILTAAPALPAHEPAWVRRLREDSGQLADMARSADGPFHVLHPRTFADNVRAFRDVLVTAGVDGQVYFGKKANNSPCWIPVCAETSAGVDVASADELTATLAGGVRGEDVVVTGPAKADGLLRLALRHRALIAVDALDELERLIALATTTRPARLLLRVLPDTDPHSRFGFDPEDLDRALERCGRSRDVLDVEGFSFHLGGYRPEPRAALADRLVARCRAARLQGLSATAISVGGGFAVDYVGETAWREFLDRHDDRWYHAGKRPERFYPYHQRPAGAAMLAAVLSAPSTAGGTVGDLLTGAGVRLLLEPGRALLDGAGTSVFGVQGYKTRRDAHGSYGIVTVDGLSMSISEQWKGSEFLPDPVLWPSRPGGEPVHACVGGASCLEYDMLTWRKVPFPRAPRFGDLVIYPNTAGYQMDKNESRFHQLPLPRRFVVEDDDRTSGPGTWRLET